MVDYLLLEKKLWTPRLRWALLVHNLNMLLHSHWRITVCQWFYWERTCTSFPWDFGHASFQVLPNQTWPCVLLLWWVLALYTTKNLENLPKHFSRTEWQKLSQIVSFVIFSFNLKIGTFITDNMCCIFVIWLLSYIMLYISYLIFKNTL